MLLYFVISLHCRKLGVVKITHCLGLTFPAYESGRTKKIYFVSLRTTKSHNSFWQPVNDYYIDFFKLFLCANYYFFFLQFSMKTNSKFLLPAYFYLVCGLKSHEPWRNQVPEHYCRIGVFQKERMSLQTW